MSQYTLKDGTGTGTLARVDPNNRLDVHSTSRGEALGVALKGQAYNINTGVISLTSANSSACLYFKNTNTVPYLLEAIAVGVGTRPSPTEFAIVKLIRNPTTGTIIDTGTAVDMNQNRNFGSNFTATATVYKGAEGHTFTNGDDVAIFYQGDGRLFASINFVIPQGSSLGIEIDPNDSTGSDVYAALIGYWEGDEN